MHIGFELEERHFQRVERICLNMPEWKLSYRGHEANAVGVLGEIIVEEWLQRYKFQFSDERNETTHDYRINSNGETFEVKTKDRTVPPKPDYVATAPAYNKSHQKPSFYIFVSLQRPDNTEEDENNVRNFTHAHIVGMCTLDFLEQRSKFRPKGFEDGSNKMEIKFDCYNILISQLEKPWDFKKNYINPILTSTRFQH